MATSNWTWLKDELTIDDLIDALQKAKQKYGGNTKIKAVGCYQSLGKINGIGHWDNKDFVLPSTEICSG